ncbi:MAG TPA: hypothetical protein EYP40_00485, partial [Chromatiales bacterium]|nr:hypothetical protein [Chromatiales bacterium]
MRHKKPSRIPKHLISGHRDKANAKFVVVPKQKLGTSTLHQVKPKNINTMIQGTVDNPRDLTARWRASWDEKFLHIWVGIIDDTHVSDSK